VNKRVFTVGTLIPGRHLPEPLTLASTLLEKEESKQQSSEIKTRRENIIVLQGRNKFEITPVKGKLLDAALNQGKPINYKCQKGTCGQCTVQVLQGPGLSKPNEQEHKKLGIDVNNSYRLACQAVIL
jgi:ferredoxin, 2Fe-2S